MALIECPECKNKISDRAVSCPKCGYELTKKNVNELGINVNILSKLKNIPKPFLAVSIILLLCLCFLLGKGINADKVDSYTSYTSNYLGITFSYPKNYNVITGDDSLIYISSKLQDNKAVIPYIMIGRYDNYSSPMFFISDFTTYMYNAYGNTFAVRSEVRNSVIGNKTVYAITYSYDVDNNTIIDNRYVISLNNKVYMIGTKEIGQNTDLINGIVTEVITSLTEGGK